MSVGLQAQERQSEIVSAVFFFSSPWKGEVGCAAAGWGSTEILGRNAGQAAHNDPLPTLPLAGGGISFGAQP